MNLTHDSNRNNYKKSHHCISGNIVRCIKTEGKMSSNVKLPELRQAVTVVASTVHRCDEGR